MKGGTSMGVNTCRKWVRKMKNSLNHLYYTGCPTTPTPVPAPPLPLAGMRQQTLPSQHMPSCSHHEDGNLGIWHIHAAFKLLFAVHWDPDPVEGRYEPAALRQEETEATKNLFPVLTSKVRKTTLSCLLEGKHNPSFWSI